MMPCLLGEIWLLVHPAVFMLFKMELPNLEVLLELWTGIHI